MGEEREEKQDVAAVGSSPDHAAWEGKALLAMQGVIVREETRCIRPWTAAVIVSSLADSRAAKDFLARSCLVMPGFYLHSRELCCFGLLNGG